MNSRRLLLATAAPLAVAVVLVRAVDTYWERKEHRFLDAPKLTAALQAFCRDESTNGQLPTEVSLRELVKGGYVTSSYMRAFEGMEVTFSTHYEDDAPQLVLARAVAPDGQSLRLLADGSIQQFSLASARK